MFRKSSLIIKMAIISILLSTCMLAKAADNSRETLPLDAFASLPAMNQASVTMDGTKIAIVRATSKNGDYIVEIYSTDDLTSDPVRLGADRMEITNVGWLNNEKLLEFHSLLNT